MLRKFNIESIILAVITVILSNTIFTFFDTSFLSPIDSRQSQFEITDIFNNIIFRNNKPDTSNVISIVDIGETYDRGEIAKIIGQIKKCTPAVIGIDIIFEGEKDNLWGNLFLESELDSVDNIVCAYKLTDYNQEKGFCQKKSSYFISTLTHPLEGYSNLPTENPTDLVRKVSKCRIYNNTRVESFPFIIGAAFNGGQTMEDSFDCTINYEPTTFPVVSHNAIEQQKSLLKNKIVLLGSTTEEADQHFTPVGKLPGIVIQAYSIQTLLNENQITPFSGWMDVVYDILWIYIVFNLILLIKDNLKNHNLLNGCDGIFIAITTILTIILVTFIDFVLYTYTKRFFPITSLLIGIAIADTIGNVYSSLITMTARKTKNKILCKSRYYIN